MINKLMSLLAALGLLVFLTGCPAETDEPAPTPEATEGGDDMMEDGGDDMMEDGGDDMMEDGGDDA